MRNREFERLQKKQLKKEIKAKIKEAKSLARKPKKNGKKKVVKKKVVKKKVDKTKEQENIIPTHMSSKQIERMARQIVRQHKNEQDDQEFEHVR